MTSLRHNEDPQSAYLDAARACILDVGWRRTTLTEVARRAGVSRMTIYRAWPDMPTVLGDLMTREWGEVVAQAVGGADAALPGEPTAADRLVAEVVATTRALRDNELFVRIVELDAELLLPYLLTRRGRSQQAIAELTAGRIEEGQAEGSIRAGLARGDGAGPAARCPRLRAQCAHHGRRRRQRGRPGRRARAGRTPGGHAMSRGRIRAGLDGAPTRVDVLVVGWASPGSASPSTPPRAG